MTMTYRINQPPFTLEFPNMSKGELQAYASWFHQILPERIAELTTTVKGTSGYEGWEPVQTPESLEPLGRWFEGQVERRKKTAEELAEARGSLKLPVAVPETELTNRTFSLAMDIGMYLSQVLLKTLPGTRWDQVLKSKQNVDYGQPVIMGFGKVSLNPVGIMVVKAYSISRGKPAELRRLYDVWAADAT
jgi:hypothetical protein